MAFLWTLSEPWGVEVERGERYALTACTQIAPIGATWQNDGTPPSRAPMTTFCPEKNTFNGMRINSKIILLH